MIAIDGLAERFGNEVELRAPLSWDELDGKMPEVVAAPRNEGAAAALVRYCGEHKVSIVPRGGGTKWRTGTPPQTFGVLLSTEHLDDVFDHDEGNATVTAGAGISLGKLGAILGERKQFFPVDDVPSSTLGGVVATNFSNAWRTKYGMPRDMITGLDVVLSDGRQLSTGAKVVKNVSGYDLPKIFTGSHGSLGLITRATVRLRPNDAVTEMRSIQYKTWESLLEAIETVLNGNFEPTILRVVVRPASKLLFIRLDGGETAVRAQLDLLGQSDTHAYDGFPPSSEWLLRAVLPLSRAVEWVRKAHDLDAHEVIWDPAVGVARAAFYDAGSDPNVAELRREAEFLGGYVVVERAHVNFKSTELVWGKPRSDAALMRRVKEAYDPGNIFSPHRFWAGI